MSKLRNEPGDALAPNRPRTVLSIRWLLVLFAAIITPLAVSYGERKVTLTVVNGTELFLHVVVGPHPYLYIAPGDSIRHEVENDKSEGIETFYITAFYSPGQALSGRFSTVREIELQYPYSGDAIDCSDDNDEETLTGSITQLILPEDLLPFPEEAGKEAGR